MEENKDIEKKNDVETQVNDTVKKEVNKNNLAPQKNNNTIVVILIIIILLLVCALVYMLLFHNGNANTNNNGNNNNQETTPSGNKEEEKLPQDEQESNEESQNENENTNEEKETKKYNLTVYKFKSDGRISDYNAANEYVKEAFKIKVSSQNAKVITVNNDGSEYLLYKDDGLYLFDVKTKNSNKLNLESNYSGYEIYLNEAKNKVIGIGYVKANVDNGWTVGYYNVNLKKKLYDGKYIIGHLTMDLQLTDDTLSIYSYSDNTAYLLSSSEEKIELSEKTDSLEYTVFGKKGSYIYALAVVSDEISIKKLYSNSKKLFYSCDGEDRYSYYNDVIYIFDDADDVIKKFNSNGEKLYTSSKYDDVKLLVNNYVVYTKNNELYLENIDDPTENKKIAPIKKEHYVWASYYTRKTLDEMEEKDKKEGLYVVVEYGYGDDGKAIRDTNGYYGVEYCYTPDKQIIEYPIKEEIGGRAKPVLYLYPTIETNITVKFAHPEYLTTTYPKYINSWNVNVSPNGDMRDKDGKYYYALYWDEKRYNEVDFKEGFYVEGKDAIKFLEEKLEYIGLNDRERNEFIMYWLPIMENNKKNLVYFELTEERELGNKLIIEPKPDSLLRLSIHIKKVNEKVSIKEQKLESFKRYGFTAVEWGGMTY